MIAPWRKLVFALGVACSHPGFAASPSTVPVLPDWSGTWSLPDSAFTASLRPGGLARSAPYRPEYLAAHLPKKMNAERCLPTGMPGTMALPLGFEFLFTTGRVIILAEEGPLVRQIHTDGRAHAPDADPTFAGDSIGHWEADSLIVDTVAISAQAQFAMGPFTSGRTHVRERFRRVGSDELRIETTIDDPEALSASWSYTLTYRRSTVPFRESYPCENDRDANGEPDLRPPPASPR
jgi:hypothetical protein